jgi:hypothetical protein
MIRKTTHPQMTQMGTDEKRKEDVRREMTGRGWESFPTFPVFSSSVSIYV